MTAAVRNNGWALQYASDALREDKEIVKLAVKKTPESLKYAKGGLNQDKDCLVAAGIWIDEEAHEEKKNLNDNAKRFVLSTKFSLAEGSTSTATLFAHLLNRHSYFKESVIYSPNAWDKNTCDPNWTDIDHPCRGTFGTCQMERELKIGVPQEHKCCWRYSFRWQLMKAKRSGGTMYQLQEPMGLGNGQKIETEMAEEVGIKVIRVHWSEREEPMNFSDIDRLVEMEKEWRWYRRTWYTGFGNFTSPVWDVRLRRN